MDHDDAPPERPVDALHRAVRGYLDHLAVERGLSRNTVQSYRRDLERYRAALAATGVRDLAQVRPERITTHLATLRAGGDGQAPLSAASTARAASAIRGLHRFAAREGYAGVDASRDVRPALPPRRLPRALDVDQVERLLTAAGALDGAGTPLAVRDRALLEFLYGTGARISEAVGAAVDDLDLTAAVVLLRGKGGRQRLVPVGRYAADALRAYLTRVRPGLAATGRGSPAIFLNARGGQLSRQSAWTVLRRAAERAGLPVDGAHAVSPHTLRHSYATHLLDGGADVRVVQELLGHASVTTTQVYTLVTVDRLREVYATSHPRARR
ncbi:site-specific tyrosine recombinase XerD [Solwaraspora sp. WMMD791]|uniref:site-specific tyrosine recombinase XerD n=1 Tax=Solwaraspora sp. WMMD791 TaxID=3016086 RepID=UPI00249C676F|nr:site-specific tyrosine recombinase XerD [Solwaraspora sp. WMMD791]WFE30498.1 site-specific tyrosine recombinase XerD [Solwaraspora sp. WMMD791]